MWRRSGFALAAIGLIAWNFRGVVSFGPPHHSARHGVRISGMAFTPAIVEVAPGDTIVWHNDDIVAHTATATRGGQWDTGVIAPGDSGRVIVATAGPVAYFCRLHPTMTASVVVR